jgi:hypothetical protein
MLRNIFLCTYLCCGRSFFFKPSCPDSDIDLDFALHFLFKCSPLQDYQISLKNGAHRFLHNAVRSHFKSCVPSCKLYLSETWALLSYRRMMIVVLGLQCNYLGERLVPLGLAGAGYLRSANTGDATTALAVAVPPHPPPLLTLTTGIHL